MLEWPLLGSNIAIIVVWQVGLIPIPKICPEWSSPRPKSAPRLIRLRGHISPQSKGGVLRVPERGGRNLGLNHFRYLPFKADRESDVVQNLIFFCSTGPPAF